MGHSGEAKMSGRVEAIWVKRSFGGAMDPSVEVTLVAGKGIERDASLGRAHRQVTVIEKEVFDRIRASLPAAEPAMRRANIMVSGVRLAESRNHVLTIGGVRILLQGETRPCERMDEQCPGLRDELAVGRRYPVGLVIKRVELDVRHAERLADGASERRLAGGALP